MNKNNELDDRINPEILLSKNYQEEKSFDDIFKNSYENFTEIDNITKVLGTGQDTIKIVKNFMTEDDYNIINKLVMSTFKKIKCSDDEYLASVNKINEYKEKIKNKAEELFKFKLEHDDYANKSHIKEHYLNGRPPGFATDIHSDLLGPENKYRWSGHISNLIYLNDNYDGGEIYFPYHKLKIKPERLMLISFPGNYYNRHGIRASSDLRVALSVFLKISDFNPSL